MRAAQELNVDHRTLTSGLETGRLSRRLRGALEKALLEGGGSPAAEQRQRNDELAGRVEVLEKGVETLGQEMRRGLAAVQDEVKALRDEQGRALQRLASRLAKVEGSGGDGQDREEAWGVRPGREAPAAEDPAAAGVSRAGDPGACRGRRGRVRGRLGVDPGVAGAEGDPPQPGQGLGVAAAAAASVGSGAGPARRARADPAAGDLSAAWAWTGAPRSTGGRRRWLTRGGRGKSGRFCCGRCGCLTWGRGESNRRGNGTGCQLTFVELD